jgi:hypothetical protein
MKALKTYLLSFLLTLGAVQSAAAGCVCRCVNGQVEAICQSAIDLRPVCGPAVCPIVPPRISPIESPRVPPVGTSQCHNQQVWNPTTGRYEWQRLCN